MGHLNYSKLRQRWRRRRGFRLNCARFSVHRLRARVFALFSIFERCFKLLGGKDSRERRWKSGGMSSSRRGFMFERQYGDEPNIKLRSCMRSNSFYAEAIADCLDFIKRNSGSVNDENESVVGLNS
ncbi:uncharacterized protein A4U43_C05F15490 [Asparagus officinalis]|uniref:Uncharacterized protein n=1 Tax=Asparagus officinalis TaxID=4686 RepID=A0A5P1ESV3_ASPOF|nr:uncharacterized protein A4U43_C05F15490 [Asparagus officinalis]